jgi:hypothetical protein
MSSFSFRSSCARSRERRFNCDSIYSTELDFVLFRTFLRSFSLSEIQRWIVSLCDFFYVFFRFRSIIFHLSIVVSIIAKSLFHIISFHWRSRCDDREMIVEKKKKLLKRKKKASIKLCCVVCVSLNQKKVKIAKILKAVIEFRFKKKELDVVFNDSKFDQFVLMSVICFVDLFQSEMMLFSSKEMKNDYEMMKFEFSNWFDDDVEIDKTNWLKDSVANFDDDDLSNWRNIRVETIQKIVLSNWLKNCVEIDEKIKKWVDVNQYDDDEKKNEKKKNYKNVFEIFLSTTIIEIIIVIIIIIIILKKNECANYVDHFENFDCLSVCSVEFFDSLSFLKKEEWKKNLESVCEKNLKEKFMCVVCFFAEFSMLENVHFDCEFCDSILILSLLSVLDSIVSFAVFFVLSDFANEKRLSFMLASWFEKKESKIEEKIVFIFCSFVCFFVNSFIESLFVFVFSISESIEWSFVVLSSKKSEIVQKEEIMFFDEKFVIKNDVSNFCETNNSSLLSLNKFCVKTIEIEKKKKKRKHFDFESFVIDFVLNCCHVNEIENLRNVVALMKKSRKYQKIIVKKKKKKEWHLRFLINIVKIDQCRTKAT